jgi:predicted transcriptional regulator
VVERTGHSRSDVPAGVVAELEAGKVEPTLDDAHRYLVNLDEQIGVTGSATTTTTTPPITTGN